MRNQTAAFRNFGNPPKSVTITPSSRYAFKECHPRCVGELDRWEGSQKHKTTSCVFDYPPTYLNMPCFALFSKSKAPKSVSNGYPKLF